MQLKKITTAVFASVLFFATQIASAEQRIISVIGTNDLHGHVEALPLLGGYLANLRAARAGDGGAVLLLDGGDMFQGTLESDSNEGALVIRAYNALGYSAAAIGNHEFDYGPVGPRAVARVGLDDPRGALKARAAEAHFPILAANIEDEQSGAAWRTGNIRSDILLDVAGIKIGVIGATTISTPFSTYAPNLAGLRVRELAAALTQQARLLRERGAVAVLVTAHAGASCNHFENPGDTLSCSGNQEIFEVARALPAGLIDAIVAGHTHGLVAHNVNGIAIIEAGEFGQAFGRIDLAVERATDTQAAHLLSASIFPPHTLCLDNTQLPPSCDAGSYEGVAVKIDKKIEELVRPAIVKANTRKAEILGVAIGAPFSNATDKESPLANLVSDLLRSGRPHADVVLTHSAGLRGPLPAGPLTYGALYDSISSDYKLAWLTLTGRQLGQVIGRTLTGKGKFLAVSGIHAQASCSGAVLQVALTRSDGRAIGDEESLRVVTSDFLATGSGSGGNLFAGIATSIEENPPLRDVVAAQLRASHKTLDPRDYFDVANPRVVYPGERPVRCAAATASSTL